MSILTKRLKIFLTKTHKQKCIKQNISINENSEYSLYEIKQMIPQSIRRINTICNNCNILFHPLIKTLTLANIQNDYCLCPKCRIKCRTKEEQLRINQKISQAHINMSIEAKKQCAQTYKETCLRKYGVSNTTQLKSTKDKMKQTNLKRYGVENASSSNIIKEKRKQTLKNKYGVEHNFLIPGIREQINKTKFKHGTAPTSKQQNYFYKLLGGQLNYPLHNLSLDIAFPEYKIEIEYNGKGHILNYVLGRVTEEEFKQKEIKRNEFIRSNGWKQIFIIAPNDKINNYTDKQYLKLISFAKMYLLHTNHHWVCINIENNLFKTSVYEQTITNILNM